MPPRNVIAPQIAPRSSGAPRPVSEPSSDKASAKPIEIPAPTDAARPTRNVSQVLWVECRGEQRRQRRYGAVHQARKSRLNVLQDEHPPGGLVLARAHILGKDAL